MTDTKRGDVLLEHATRHWEAEVENARRHGVRMSGLLTLISAVLGIGLFNLGNIHQLGLSASAIVLRWMLGLGLIYLFVALHAGLRGIRSDARASASSLLALSDEHLPAGVVVFDLTKKEALEASYTRVVSAAKDLQEQNTRKQGRIDRVQHWLCIAGAHAGAGILCFLLIPAVLEPKSVASSQVAESQETTRGVDHEEPEAALRADGEASTDR